MLLYRHRGDVVSNDRIRAELSGGGAHPCRFDFGLSRRPQIMSQPHPNGRLLQRLVASPMLASAAVVSRVMTGSRRI
jgi:hypothetical protein